MKIINCIFVISAIILSGCSADTNEKLPISTGNFSVYWIQHSPIGRVPDPNFNGEPVPPASNWSEHKKNGLNAYEDYAAWGAIEREPGKWDWSRQIETAKAQKAGGLEYHQYLWIMNPPMWMREGQLPPDKSRNPNHYTVMKCLEHGEETQTFSIWDPATIRWFERYYRESKSAMGDLIDRIYIGLVGPYGEGNYPLPMFDWLNIGHCHEGYWCGDKYARLDFANTMKRKYKFIQTINDSWNTSYKKWSEVSYPSEVNEDKILKAEDRTDVKSRRQWIDFVEWYHQSLIDFSVEITKSAMKYYPVDKLKMKPGGSAGGVNPITWGTYCPGYAKADALYKVRMQPADCHGRPFADRWYGTAYRFYNIPFSTEPAGSMDEITFKRRVFMDACNGATEMFAYEWDKHGENGRKWIHLYKGVPSITKTAVMCPTTWYRMNGDLWPMIRKADELRDIIDFEVADEILIRDDYLTKSNIKVLLWLDGYVTENDILNKLLKWVESGGILIISVDKAISDVEGKYDIGKKLLPIPNDNNRPSIKKVGKGFVVNWNSENSESLSDVVARSVYHPEFFDTALKGEKVFDEENDNIWTAVFPDFMLLFNNGEQNVSVKRIFKGKEHTISMKKGELVEIK